MSRRKPRAEDPVGDLVEGLRGHREQARAVRHGEPAQQPAAEELDHPRRRVEHRQGVARRRRVDDDEVVVAGGVEVVELLHRQVVVAVHEAAGDVLVQRVGQHGVADLGVGGVAADEVVPAGLGVEHRRPQLAARLDAGGLERRVGHPAGRVAEGADAERVGEAPGRVDGQHEHLAALVRRRPPARARRRPSSCRRRPSRARAPSPCSPAGRRARPAPRRSRDAWPSGHATSSSSASALATSATTRRPVALVNSSGT